MNARELLDDLESGLIDEFMTAEVKAIYIRALRLLAVIESAEGETPEMTQAAREGSGIECGCRLERERNGLAARVGELEAELDALKRHAEEVKRDLAASVVKSAGLEEENSKLRSALAIVHFKREPWQ